MSSDNLANQIQDELDRIDETVPVAVVIGGTPEDENGPDRTIVIWDPGDDSSNHRTLYGLLTAGLLNRAISHVAPQVID